MDEVNPKGGFVKYGLVKNGFVVLKGSIPGPSKRLVMLRKAVRPIGKHNDAPEYYIHKHSFKTGSLNLIKSDLNGEDQSLFIGRRSRRRD